jgi:hypothetical protein
VGRWVFACFRCVSPDREKCHFAAQDVEKIEIKGNKGIKSKKMEKDGE